jgi:LEA14-like dessication related protein
MKCFLLSFSAGLLLLTLACSPSVRPPKIEVRGVGAKGASELAVELMFYNPNRMVIDIAGLDYRIAIESLICGEGRYDQPLHLGAMDSTHAEFPLRLDYPNLIRSVPALLSDTVGFRIEGTYTLRTIIGPRRMNFRQGKRIALKSQLGSVLRDLFK